MSTDFAPSPEVQAQVAQVVAAMDEPDDGKVPCPDCGGRYFPGPGMGVHRNAAHTGSGRRSRRKSCPDCGKLIGTKDMARHRRDIHGMEPLRRGRPPGVPNRPKAPPMASLTADEVTSATAALLWPNGIPHDKLTALMQWHQQTEQFLSEVSH